MIYVASRASFSFASVVDCIMLRHNIPENHHLITCIVMTRNASALMVICPAIV